MIVAMTTHPRVTKTGTQARCHGLHHKDTGEIVICERCQAKIVQLKNGRLVGTMDLPRYFCWSPSHVCDPGMVEWVAQQRAAQLSSGEIVKGQTVKVVRGRNVPKGTQGSIFWTGSSAYGKRVGIRDENGKSWFTYEKNVEAMLD